MSRLGSPNRAYSLRPDWDNFYIINFNYTDTIFKYLREGDQNPSVIVNFIHGDLKDIESEIVFGYGNDQHKLYSDLKESKIEIPHSQVLDILSQYHYGMSWFSVNKNSIEDEAESSIDDLKKIYKEYLDNLKNKEYKFKIYNLTFSHKWISKRFHRDSLQLCRFQNIFRFSENFSDF